MEKTPAKVWNHDEDKREFRVISLSRGNDKNKSHLDYRTVVHTHLERPRSWTTTHTHLYADRQTMRTERNMEHGGQNTVGILGHQMNTLVEDGVNLWKRWAALDVLLFCPLFMTLTCLFCFCFFTIKLTRNYLAYEKAPVFLCICSKKGWN